MGLFSRKKPSEPAPAAPVPAAVPCQVCGQAVREDLMTYHRQNHFELISDTGLQAGFDAEAYRNDPASRPRQTAIYRMRSRERRGMDSEIALVAAYLARSYPRDASIQYLPTRHYACSYDDIGNGDLVSEIIIIVHY